MSMRGLIIIPEVFADWQRNTVEIRIGDMTQVVKQYLPYWDKFDLPEHWEVDMKRNLPHLFLDSDRYKVPGGYQLCLGGGSRELEELHRLGILRKTRVILPDARPMGVAEYWIRSQLEVWRQSDAKEPSQWSIAQLGESNFLPESAFIKSGAIEVKLYDALPIPSPDVSVEEIIRFKDRRSAELLSLRSAIDGLHWSIIQSADIPRAKNLVIEQLERSLIDVKRVSAESWKPGLLLSTRVQFSIPEIMRNAAAGAVMATSFGLPPTLGMGVGGLLSMLKFEIKRDARSAKMQSGVASLAYACKVGSEWSHSRENESKTQWDKIGYQPPT